MKKSLKKKIFISVICVFIACVIGAGATVGSMMGYFNKGNSTEYSVRKTEKTGGPLEGKTIIFLGSSVTYGYASMGESFADFLEKQDGIIAVKAAKSGTTLVDDSTDSYISRMKNIDKSVKADLLLCQLSTNDATKDKPLGTLSDKTGLESFDTKTVIGAVEYIIAYAEKTWNCPVMFYTSPQYDSENYEKMVDVLNNEIAPKWNIGVIDLWNNKEINSITDEERKIYMVDNIHPSRAGYRELWLPVFRQSIENFI